MSEHKIKIKKKYYDVVLSGEKTFEIRKNDRDYKVGDIIHFVPIADDCNMIIPHNPNEYKITYVFHGGEYGLEKGYCVFGIAPTIEAAPVGHGEWIKEENTWVCSVCRKENACAYDEILCRFTDFFCPKCGAKMKGGADQ